MIFQCDSANDAVGDMSFAKQVSGSTGMVRPVRSVHPKGIFPLVDGATEIFMHGQTMLEVLKRVVASCRSRLPTTYFAVGIYPRVFGTK